MAVCAVRAVDLDDFLPPHAYGVFEASFTRNLEYGVDALADVLAPGFPLPPAHN